LPKAGISDGIVKQLVVIGASAGGVSALSALVARLPRDFAAPLLVVLHIGAHRSILADILGRAGPLPAEQARQGRRIEAGRIYVAAPDRHLLVMDDTLHLSNGAKEHHARPAIDPLFLSAALARGPRAIGVLLTGRLDDGTAGLQAIKACGGTAIVQDPADAEVPDMPASALRTVEVDHCVTLAEMPRLLTSLASRPVEEIAARPPPAALVHEQALFLAKGNAMEHLAEIGTPSIYACPDCHGGLWEVSGAKPRRFRCHTGHAFSARTLQDTLAGAADESLWNARRALQERLLLLREMEAGATAEHVRADAVRGAASRLQDQLGQLESLMARAPEPIE
jgi:two-component system, chemotaxis family, protein-glutamate methylesterase/glutaminase